MWILRIVALLAALSGIWLGAWMHLRPSALLGTAAPLAFEAHRVAVAQDLRPTDTRERPRMVFKRPVGTTAPLSMPFAPVAAGSGFYFERFIVSQIQDDSLPEQVVVGDVTGDRLNDIVVTLDEWEEVRVRIHAQNADGTLAPAIEYTIPIVSGVGGSLELADLDGNGLPEIVVGAGNGITVFSKAPGGYSRASYTGIVKPRSFAVIDTDGDGFQDVVAQNWSDGADIYVGDGKGGVSSVQHVATLLGAYTEVTDFTADGLDDLIMTNGQGWAKLLVYPFTPDGLGGAITIDLDAVLSDLSSGMTVADVDRDGRPDLVIADEGSDIEPRGIHVLYRGQGDEFEDEAFLQFTGMYDTPGAVHVADVDGNGYADIVTMINSDDRMAYFLQGPSGFADPVFQRTDDNPWTNSFYWDNSFAIADVNSDRCPDVVLAEVSSSLRIFYGRGCQVSARKTGGQLLPTRL